jgi:hypothetical protein
VGMKRGQVSPTVGRVCATVNGSGGIGALKKVNSSSAKKLLGQKLEVEPRNMHNLSIRLGFAFKLGCFLIF